VLVAASATPESAPLLAALADDLLELRRRI
jgi:hypothetical protein